MWPQHYTFIGYTQDCSDETLFSLNNEDQLPAFSSFANDDLFPVSNPLDNENESEDVNFNNDSKRIKESISTTMGEGPGLVLNFCDETSLNSGHSESKCPSMKYIVDNFETFRKTISMLPIDVEIWFDEKHHKFNSYRLLLPVDEKEEDIFNAPTEYLNDILLQMLLNW